MRKLVALLIAVNALSAVVAVSAQSADRAADEARPAQDQDALHGVM